MGIWVLMNKDRPILKYDMNERYMEVIDNALLPYELKDFIQTSNFSSRDGYIKSSRDFDALRDYLSSRVLSIGRENAKVILNVSTLPQVMTTENAIKIVQVCHGVSVNDSYWIRREEEDLTYKNINVRTNSLSEAAYEVAVLGRYISLTADDLRPELVTDGMFAKVWKRNKDNGDLELWKTDKTTGFVNTKAELLASKILDSSNVNHVSYRREKNCTHSLPSDDRIFAVCSCISTDEVSHIRAQAFMDWCRHMGYDWLDFVETYAGEDFHKMLFMDYVFANTDRHSGNWWFAVDVNSNQIIELGPLMDHNQAFISDEFGTDIRDEIYEPTGMTFEDGIKKYCRYFCELDIDISLLPEKCLERYQEISQYYVNSLTDEKDMDDM